jgi:hypothetical protein
MLQIMPLRTDRLRNAEYYKFFMVVNSVIDPFVLETYRLTKTSDVVQSLFERMSKIFRVNTSFFTTPDIENDDHARDAYFIGFKGYVNSFTYFGTTEEKEAGAIIEHLMKPYRNANSSTYQENTALLYKFIVDLGAEKYADAIATLKLADRITELGNLNKKFDETFNLRSGDRLDKAQTVNFRALRVEMDLAYSNFREIVNANCRVFDTFESPGPIKDFEPFITTINKAVVEMQLAIARRSGGSHNDSHNPEEPTKPTDPDNGGDGSIEI